MPSVAWPSELGHGWHTGWGMLVGFVAAKALVDWRLLALAGGNLESWHADDAAQFPFRYAVLVWGAWWQLLRGGVQWKGRRI